MTRVRVLVAEDSATVRAHLCEILRGDAEIELVGEAADGAGAIAMCAQLRPDVVTLDMMMPGTSGLAATEMIMAHTPTPILIVSASTNRGDLFRTYDALAAGAVDVMEKPTGEEGEDWARRFLATVKLVSRVRVITHLRGRLAPPRREGRGTSGAPQRVNLVALGASTGGPGAIMTVLASLRAPAPVPILVVLHIGAPFGSSFAEWLDKEVPHPVHFAAGGERLAELAGHVVLAPPDNHLEVRAGSLALSSAPERHSCRPSIDVLFESLAREGGRSTAACLLTGMGRDGALGLLRVREAGGLTIAQDEATSVVFGMPREAVVMGAAEHVLPLGSIAAVLTAAMGGEGEGP